MNDTTMIGLAEALDAAKDTRAYRAGVAFGVPADGLEQYTAEVIRAAAPIIERQVREQVAQAIEAQQPEMGRSINVSTYRQGRHDGMYDAARIARGES